MIEKATYKDQVVNFIYKEILKGNLKPKSQIKESHLSERLQISRAPIREALKELVVMGLAEYKPRIGTFIIDLDPQDIVDTYSTRGVLEGYACRMSYKMFTEGDIDKLYGMCDRMEILAESHSNIALIDLGDEFHNYLFKGCKNGQLVRFTKTLSIKSHLMFSQYWPKLYSPNQIRDRHISIVKSIKQANAADIEGCIREHYIQTGQKIAELKKRGV